MRTICEVSRERLLERLRTSALKDVGVDAHMVGCSACQIAAKHIGELIAAERAHLDAPVDSPLIARVATRLHSVIAEQAARRRKREPWWLPWLISLGTATAIAVTTIVFLTRQRSADAVAIIANDATANAVTLRANAVIHAGDTIEVNGSLLVRLGSQRLVGAATTRLRFASTDPHHVATHLDHGRIVARAEPVDNRPSTFAVSWPDGDLVATTTVFQVIVAAASSEVSVARGEVRVHVRASDRWVVVHEGSALLLESGEAHERLVSQVERDALLDATQTPRPSVTRERALGGDSAESETGSGDANARKSENGRDTGAGLEAEGEHAVEAARESELAHEPAPRGIAFPNGQRLQAPAPKPRDPIPAVTAEEAARAGDCAGAAQHLDRQQLPRDARGRALVAIADCFRGHDDGPQALVWYERAARETEGTPAGENAAYDLARMLMEKGRSSEADAAFASYLARYPRGTLAAEAMLNRCSFAVQDSRGDDALACLRDYRERFPRNTRVRDTYLLEATVLRAQKGDCVAARLAYDTYLRDPGAYADEARSWKRWCEAHRAEGPE